MTEPRQKRILVTGGGTFLGTSIIAALLSEGAEVTVLIRPGAEKRLGPLATRVRWHTVDIWDPASLRGRARGHGAVIHTVGSMIADPAQGLTHHRLNTISARNAINMCISDGVPRIVLMSAAKAPWVSQHYVRAKREAETYVGRVGLQAAIIRAPLVYVRGHKRPLFYQFLSSVGSRPPLSWTALGNIAPMPLDMLARAVARIALENERGTRIYRATDLRRRNRREEVLGRSGLPERFSEEQSPALPFAPLDDEDLPFGWIPPTKSDDIRPR